MSSPCCRRSPATQAGLGRSLAGASSLASVQECAQGVRRSAARMSGTVAE
jgi:hypothetical protein